MKQHRHPLTKCTVSDRSPNQRGSLNPPHPKFPKGWLFFGDFFEFVPDPVLVNQYLPRMEKLIKLENSWVFVALFQLADGEFSWKFKSVSVLKVSLTNHLKDSLLQ